MPITDKRLITRHTNTKLMSIGNQQQVGKPMSPTEKRIAELRAQTSAKIAELKATGVRADLIAGIQRNSKMSDGELYTLAKPFCNLIEHQRRKEAEASGQPKQHRGKGKNTSA